MTALKRFRNVALLTLLATALALTAAVAPASAAYSPQVSCNRSQAHRGQAVACQMRHFPASHHGTVSVTARFWVRNKHRHHHHGRHLSHLKTKTLAGFTTSRHGNKLVAFSIPAHIRKGSHPFVFTVGRKSRSVHIRVV